MNEKIKAGFKALKRNFETRERFVHFLEKFIRANLYVMIFCLPFSKAIIEITATISISCWILRKFLAKELRLPRTPLNLPIFLFLAFNLISVFISIWNKLSLHTFLFKTLEYIAIYFVVVDSFTKRKQIHKVIYLILAISSILVLDGLFQAVTHRELLRGRGWAWGDNIGRIGASFNTPADFGGYIITVLPIIFLLAFIQNNYFKRTRYYIISFLLAVCLFLTLSRSAWFGFIFGILFMWAFCYKVKKQVLLISFLALLAFVSAFMYLDLESYIGLAGGSLADRIKIWHIGWRIFKDSPIFGQGPGTFMFNFNRYKPASYLYIVYAHNCYLQMLGEIGIVGLLSFLGIAFVFLKTAITSIFKTKDDFYKLLLMGSTSGILSYLIQAGLDTNLYSLPLAVLFWFMLGFVMAIAKL